MLQQYTNWNGIGSVHYICLVALAGWQKLREAEKGLRQQVWKWTKISSPNIRYFVAILKFVATFALKSSISQMEQFSNGAILKSSISQSQQFGVATTN